MSDKNITRGKFRREMGLPLLERQEPVKKRFLEDEVCFAAVINAIARSSLTKADKDLAVRLFGTHFGIPEYGVEKIICFVRAVNAERG